jgi:hypothetical protein
MAKESALQLAATIRDKYRQHRDPLLTSKDQWVAVPAETNRTVSVPIDHNRFNPSLQELADILGKEWKLVSTDPYLLAEWVHLIRTNRMVEAGVVPPWFKTRAHCRNCGDVLLDGGCSGILVGCPWCWAPNKPDFVH